MSKMLIVLLTVFLLTIGIFIFLRRQYSKDSLHTAFFPTVITSPLTSRASLSFIPSTLDVTAGKTASASISVFFHGNPPSIIQLEIGYDPAVLTDVHIIPGSFFSNPAIILQGIDESTGRISYALKRQADSAPLQQTGDAAFITFVPRYSLPGQTAITFLPKTAILTKEATNILSAAYGMEIHIASTSAP